MHSTAGTWFVGVLGDRREGVSFAITISKYDCPMGCSGHGACLGDHTCDCNDVSHDSSCLFCFA